MNALISMLGGSIFDFVYVLIVVQLSLLGPVLVALVTKNRTPSMMWIGIAAGAVIGTASAIVGSKIAVHELVDGAGTIASVVSVICAVVIYKLAGRGYGFGPADDEVLTR